jgi:hypothetical protein
MRSLSEMFVGGRALNPQQLLYDGVANLTGELIVAPAYRCGNQWLRVFHRGPLSLAMLLAMVPCTFCCPCCLPYAHSAKSKKGRERVLQAD